MLTASEFKAAVRLKSAIESSAKRASGSYQRVVRDRQVWIRSRGGNPAIVGKGYPLCELMTKEEAVEEAKLWPRKFYAVRIRIVPNSD